MSGRFIRCVVHHHYYYYYYHHHHHHHHHQHYHHHDPYQGKIKELELQVEQLQRAKDAKRPKTGTTLPSAITSHSFDCTPQLLPPLLLPLLLVIRRF